MTKRRVVTCSQSPFGHPCHDRRFYSWGRRRDADGILIRSTGGLARDAAARDRNARSAAEGGGGGISFSSRSRRGFFPRDGSGENGLTDC